MRVSGKIPVVGIALLWFSGCRPHTAAVIETPAPAQATAPRSQNPSPMLETARRHERITTAIPAGIRFTVDSVFAKPVEVLIPERAGGSKERTLLIHLFGAAYVPFNAASGADNPYVVAVVNLGGGSSAYERPLSDSTAWNALIRKLREQVETRSGARITRVLVSAFSAGYGGVRALLSNDAVANAIDGVILLDGLHTSYMPERTVLSEGGVLDTAKLAPFLPFARRSVAGGAKMLITHSEIFPGTFASTTETTDWLIAALGLKRTPVLAWGPGGMQQISEVRSGGLAILGFAGNTGPDHIDHLHGLGGFLVQMENRR